MINPNYKIRFLYNCIIIDMKYELRKIKKIKCKPKL